MNKKGSTAAAFIGIDKDSRHRAVQAAGATLHTTTSVVYFSLVILHGENPMGTDGNTITATGAEVFIES